MIIGPFSSSSKSVAVKPEISKSLSISSLTLSYEKPPLLSSGNLLRSILLASFVKLEIDL